MVWLKTHLLKAADCLLELCRIVLQFQNGTSHKHSISTRLFGHENILRCVDAHTAVDFAGNTPLPEMVDAVLEGGELGVDPAVRGFGGFHPRGVPSRQE